MDRSVKDPSLRSGFVLVTVLVLATAVALMAHAGLMIGVALDRAARASAGTAEIDAGMARRVAIAGASLATLDDPLPPGVEGRRLSPELLRIRADSAGQGRVGVIWALDPATRIASLGAGVRAGRGVPTADAARITADDADECSPEVVGPAGLPLTMLDAWAIERPLDLGPLDSASWLGLDSLPAVAPGGVTAFRGDGHVRLAPGTWSGVLVIDGSLDVGDGVEITGWVAVTGDVTVGLGGRLVGTLRAGGGVAVHDGGEVRVAPCTAVARMRSLPILTVPRALRPIAWPADPPVNVGAAPPQPTPGPH